MFSGGSSYVDEEEREFDFKVSCPTPLSLVMELVGLIKSILPAKSDFADMTYGIMNARPHFVLFLTFGIWNEAMVERYLIKVRTIRHMIVLLRFGRPFHGAYAK